MASRPQSVPAVSTLDSASDAEMAGVAASASKKAKGASDKIFWKQDLFAQTLTNDLHHVFVVYIINNMLPFQSALVLSVLRIFHLRCCFESKWPKG